MKANKLHLALFAVLGALIALFPINFGDLGFFGQLLVGSGVAFLGTGFVVFGYNFAFSNKFEEKGEFNNGGNLTVVDRGIAASVGAIIMVIISAMV